MEEEEKLDLGSNLISHLIPDHSLLRRQFNKFQFKDLYLLCNHVKYIIFLAVLASLCSSEIYALYMTESLCE